MEYIKAFESETALIAQYGKDKFFTVWAMGMYLDTSDLAQLAQDNLTDCNGDKKIDFMKYEADEKALYVVQGYYSKNPGDSAKANKASDLNTAAAWLTNGDLKEFPTQMQSMVTEVRNAITNGELSQIEVIYVHNCGESKAIQSELETVSTNLKQTLKDFGIEVTYKEIGSPTLERLYLKQAANIVIEDEIVCPFKIQYEEQSDPQWKSSVLSVSGTWLREIYKIYQSKLFSANYRGYLGLNRNRINKGIKSSAEHNASRFWAYNNGITILTTQYVDDNDKTKLSGISIINGAQTTGSLGQLPDSVNLDNVKIMTRIIQCTDPDLIADIVKFNNTQNRITSWDSYGNDAMQTVLHEQFATLNYEYNYKRGFESHTNSLNIETCIQPLLSFVGKYKDANRSKTTVFETRSLYTEAFENVKARHVLFVCCLFAAISEIKMENKARINTPGFGDSDKAVYEALAPLKSKHFIMSIVAEVIRKLNTGLPVLKEISLMPNLSDATLKSLGDIVADIKPFVSVIITNIANYDSANGVYSHYSDPDIVNTIASDVEGKISSIAAVVPEFQTQKQNFMNMLCNG